MARAFELRMHQSTIIVIIALSIISIVDCLHERDVDEGSEAYEFRVLGYKGKNCDYPGRRWADRCNASLGIRCLINGVSGWPLKPDTGKLVNRPKVKWNYLPGPGRGTCLCPRRAPYWHPELLPGQCTESADIGNMSTPSPEDEPFTGTVDPAGFYDTGSILTRGLRRSFAQIGIGIAVVQIIFGNYKHP